MSVLGSKEHVHYINSLSGAHDTYEVVKKVLLCLLEQNFNLQTAKQFASLAAAVKLSE